MRPYDTDDSDWFSVRYMYRTLLIDSDARHAERLITRLQSEGLAIERVRRPEEAIGKLRARTKMYELVIVDVSDTFYPWHRALARLQEECRLLVRWPGPLFLCVSRAKKPPEFILRIEHMGARYVCEG
jgi:PleD family two-component response regulator